MTLQEKIYYCRKKAGLSQEALAQQIGVSRQAISKWETGDAEPEISKLRLLAKAFHVTADWLLSEGGLEEETSEKAESSFVSSTSNSTWIDSIPGVLGKLLRKYSWLFGVYLSIGGAGFTFIGALARYMTRKMFMGVPGSMFSETNDMILGEPTNLDPFGNQINNTLSDLAANNPVFVMGTAIMVIGIGMVVVGIALAVILKRRSKK